MKTRILSLLVFAFSAMLSHSAFGQHKLALHSGYDITYDAAYIGAGAVWNDLLLTTVELGYSGEQLITKADVAIRFLQFDESEVDLFIGLGYGYTFPTIEETFNDHMAELLFTMNYHSVYAGYGLGFFLPGDPNLEGFGNYHYFRIGVLIEDL